MSTAAGSDQGSNRTGPPATGEPPADSSRRQFFRRMAGDVLTTAAQVTAVVSDLRSRSAAEASVLLGEPSTDAPVAGSSTEASGFRTAFRFESDDVLLVIDQRQLPQALVELPIRSAPEAASAIRNLAVGGAPAIGQVAALGLALSARFTAGTKPHNRRAILENAAIILKNARPTPVNLPWAVDRVMAPYRAIGELSTDGEAIARAMHDEAMLIVAEAMDDHGRIAETGLGILPVVEGRPLRILTLGSSGLLAGGQFGTALGVVQAAHGRELPLHVWVAETRPNLQGARLTAWELKQLGVPHALVADFAVEPLLAAGEVDVVLVGAERVAANGDLAGTLGTATVAALAARGGVPVVACLPLSSVDLATPSGAGIPIEERPIAELTTIRGTRVAPENVGARNPAVDVTDAALIAAIVTEEGVLRAPFGPALAGAVEGRAARRAATRAAKAAALAGGA